jgi:Tfp pilus assembly protein PilX
MYFKALRWWYSMTVRAFSSGRRRGVAIIGIVLVMFVLFSIVTLVAFNAGMQTLFIEKWQTQHFEKSRLTYLARSAVNAAAEQLIEYQKDNAKAFNYFSDHPFDDKNTGSVVINDSDFNVTLELTVSGDTEPYLYIMGKATNSDSKSSVVSATYDTEKEKIVEWIEEE